ncbi:MAG: GerAB/ArcD/ProY family transporter [Bacilli bacterium]
MKNIVTNRQIFFIIFLTLSTYTSIDLPHTMAKTAGRSSWLIIIITALIFGLLSIVITKLNYTFQNKVLFDYSQEIVGKTFSKFIILFYLLFFIIIGVYLKLKLAGVITAHFLPKTPPPVILFLSITLFGYVANKGITNIARMFEIIGVLFLIVTIILCTAMLLQGISYNIMPFFNKSETREYMKTFKDLFTPFTGLAVLFAIPFTSKNKKVSKVAFLTVLFIGLFYVLIVESTIMIIGINNTIAYKDAFIEAIKIVELPVIERTDIFYLTFGLMSLFSGKIIIYAVILEIASKLFSNVKKYILAIIIGIIFYILSIIGLNIKDLNSAYESFAPYLVILSSMVIPLSLLIISKLKKININNLENGESDNGML